MPLLKFVLKYQNKTPLTLNKKILTKRLRKIRLYDLYKNFYFYTINDIVVLEFTQIVNLEGNTAFGAMIYDYFVFDIVQNI